MTPPALQPLRRLVGLETEYAIRFSPAWPQAPRPGNDRIYDAVVRAVEAQVPTRAGRRRMGRKRVFTANGGSVCYESLPQASHGGLLEGASPECRGPSELLLYQQAQEALLVRACADAAETLSSEGYPGEVGLLKNGRDGFGNVYGPQENFEVEVARGPALWAWRAGLALLVPPLLVLIPIAWTMLIAVLALAVVVALLLPLLEAVGRGLSGGRSLMGWLVEDGRGERLLGYLDIGTSMLLQSPVSLPFALLTHLFAFRRVRRGALAFLLSRPAFSGTGTVEEDGRFGLSEKGPTVRRVMRWSILPAGRAVFDTGNLMKALALPVALEFGPLWRLFRRRQRMQLGLADANRCQIAEYLKIGATTLVVDLAEAGLLDDAPQLRRPLDALRAWIADPTLRARAAVRGGGQMTALEVQRWYLERARVALRTAAVHSLEADEVLRLWGEALDALEGDVTGLVGRLDWVTKRYLLERAGGLDAPAVLKKIDLRYAELGEGYLAQLEQAGVAPRLVQPDEAWAAVDRPPADTPATIRGRIIRQLSDERVPGGIGWDTVRVGTGLRSKVVRLADFRRERDGR